MAYTEVRYADTKEDAEKAKAFLDSRFGGFPCSGTTTIQPCQLTYKTPTGEQLVEGFKIVCIHYGTN